MRRAPLKSRAKSSRGLALINALLVVAALSAVAVLLLARAETARIRQQQVQEVLQTRAYLNGFEDLLRVILDADRRAGEADHLREAWAQENYTVQIGRGTASGTIRDLQGRFNLNWLGTGDAVFGPEAFRRLMQTSGQSDSLTRAIEDWISEDGPVDPTPYFNRTPALAPRGGALSVLEDLRLVSGMTPAHYARLEPLLAVVPAEASVNINTAPQTVLQAFLSDLPAASINALLAERAANPFESNEQLAAWFGRVLSVEDYQTMDIGRFIVSSRWFEAEISATLGQTHLTRRVIFHRSAETGKTEVHLRYATRD